MVRNGGADGQQRERRSHAVEEEQERWRQRHRVAGTAALPLSQFIVREHALRSGEQLDDDGNDVEADVRALRDAVPSSYQEYVESLEFKAYDADCSVLELVLNEHHAMWRKERLQEDHEAQFGRASLACQLIQNVHELLAVLERSNGFTVREIEGAQFRATHDEDTHDPPHKRSKRQPRPSIHAPATTTTMGSSSSSSSSARGHGGVTRSSANGGSDRVAPNFQRRQQQQARAGGLGQQPVIPAAQPATDAAASSSSSSSSMPVETHTRKRGRRRIPPTRVTNDEDRSSGTCNAGQQPQQPQQQPQQPQPQQPQQQEQQPQQQPGHNPLPSDMRSVPSPLIVPEDSLMSWLLADPRFMEDVAQGVAGVINTRGAEALRNEPDLIGTAAEELLQGAFDMLASPMPAPAAASRTNSAAAAVPHAPPPPPPPSSSSSSLAPQPPSRVLRSPRKPAHPLRRLASLDMARPLIPAGDSGDESERSVAEALVNLTEQQPPLQQEQQREAPDKAPGNQPQQPQPQQPPQPPQPQQPPQPPQQQHVEDVPRSESTPLIPTPTAATVPAVAKPTKQDNDNDGGGDGNDGDDAGGADTKTGDGGDTSADEGGIASEVAAMDDDDMDAFLSELHGEE